MTVTVRPAQLSDLDAVVAIELTSFTDPWTLAMFRSHLLATAGHVFLLAEDDGVVIGYAMSRTIAEEAELLNIAVDTACRNAGAGALLLDTAMEQCRRDGALEMWLEVRASNAAALGLYDSRGFVAVSVRKRYYHAPREDALVLRTDLHPVPRTETVPASMSSLAAGPVDSILSPASHFSRQETK